MDIKELEAQLAAAKKEAADAQAALAQAAKEAKDAQNELATLNKQIQAGTATAKVPGKYKGYSFEDGHLRVRNAQGEICDSAALLKAAADQKDANHAAACEVLDYLIEIKYAYFTK